MIDYEEDWATDDCAGQQIARWCNLPRAEPIVCSDDQMVIMFRAGDKFYF